VKQSHKAVDIGEIAASLCSSQWQKNMFCKGFITRIFAEKNHGDEPQSKLWKLYRKLAAGYYTPAYAG
jgi:hypothetical protein